MAANIVAQLRHFFDDETSIYKINSPPQAAGNLTLKRFKNARLYYQVIFQHIMFESNLV